MKIVKWSLFGVTLSQFGLWLFTVIEGEFATELLHTGILCTIVILLLEIKGRLPSEPPVDYSIVQEPMDAEKIKRITKTVGGCG
jgi:hypothetical protein